MSRRAVALAVALATALVAVGCSDDEPSASDEQPTTSEAERATTELPDAARTATVVPQYDGDVNSPYCRTARGWAARLIEGYVEDDPAEVQAFSRDRDAYVALARSTAPPELREAWDRYGVKLTDIAAALELSNWDLVAAGQVLDADLRAVMDGADADGHVIAAYDTDVCGVGEPPLVDTDYTGSDASACAALPTLVELRTSGMVGGPETGAALLAAFGSTGSVEGGPQGFAADVAEYREWMSGHATPILERFGGDLARLLREAGGNDALVVSGWAPDIRDVVGRVERYVADVCVTPTELGDGEPTIDATDAPPIDDPGDEPLDETGPTTPR